MNIRIQERKVTHWDGSGNLQDIITGRTEWYVEVQADSMEHARILKAKISGMLAADEAGDNASDSIRKMEKDKP